MKVGKLTEQGDMQLIECEQGMEVNGDRSTDELYADGFKDVCEVEAPSENATCTYEDYGSCWVQVWSDEPLINE